MQKNSHKRDFVSSLMKSRLYEFFYRAVTPGFLFSMPFENKKMHGVLPQTHYALFFYFPQATHPRQTISLVISPRECAPHMAMVSFSSAPRRPTSSATPSFSPP